MPDAVITYAASRAPRHRAPRPRHPLQIVSTSDIIHLHNFQTSVLVHYNFALYLTIAKVLP